MPRNATKKAAEHQAKSAEDQMKKARPNVEKMCLFWELPKLLRAPILKKLDAVSMTHMRRTSKAMNVLVENEDLRAPSDHKLVIKIELDLGKIVLSFLTTRGEFCFKNNLDLFDVAMYFKECKFTKITNPREQLVGVHFKFIAVEFALPNEESALGFWTFFEIKALPILKALRPRCDILVFHEIDCCDVSSTLPLISFKSLKFENSKVDSTKMKWNVENGNVLIIRKLATKDITSAFGAIVQFKKVTLSVYFHTTGVKEVAKAIREMPLGKLEILQLIDSYRLYDSSDEEEDDDNEEDGPEEEMNDEEERIEEGEQNENLHDPRRIRKLPSVQTLRSKDSEGLPASIQFYKMPMDHGGYAIITQNWYDSDPDTIDFKFYVYAQYSRKNLFDSFLHSHSYELEEVIDSPQYREFFLAETDEIAINQACEHCDDFDQWIEENRKSTDTSDGSEQ